MMFFDKKRSDGNSPLSGLNICICTPDYMHLVRNGGIGTSFQHTISVLAPMGADITVLYANLTPGMNDEDRARAVQLVEQDGAKLEYLFPEPAGDALSTIYPSDIFTATSYTAYQWLKAKSFDLVIFADWRGIAYHSVHAKRQGLAFAQTQLWIQAHSTALWHELNNQHVNYDETHIRVYHYERKAIELCDRVLGATQYLVDWMSEHGFVLPQNTSVYPLIINTQLLASSGLGPERDRGGARKIREIAFFGRLEKRKGLHLFLQALQRLWKYNRDLLSREQIRITFLGKITIVDGVNSVTFIERELSGLDIDVSVNPSLSSSEAVSYLKRNDALAIMPSLTDNSPLTVHECINAGIAFIAAGTGGIPELIHPDDHEAVLVQPSSVALADRIVEIIAGGQRSIRPAVDQAGANIPRWVERLQSVKASNQKILTPQDTAPLVSVCLVHFERPVLLRKTLDGLMAQTYKNFEIILIDNDSRSEEAVRFLGEIQQIYDKLNIHIEKLPDLYAGAARNKALSLARGDYIVFMDDDNYAHPSQIELFVRAITTSGYDALSCALVVFDAEDDPADLKRFIHLYLPAGSGIALNLFSNSYGDANGIYRKSSLQAVGGLTEERLSWEDYELFSKLEQNGFKVGVIPEPLVYLRASVGSVSRRGSMLSNYYRALRPALKNFPWSTFGDALLVALTPRFHAAVAQRYEVDDTTDDLRILNNSETPLVVSRLLIERAFRSEGFATALRHLGRLVSVGGNQEKFRRDWLFLRVAAILAPEGAFPEQAGGDSDLAVQCAELYKKRSFAPVADLVSDNRVPASEVDARYMEGLKHLLSGRNALGLQTWAAMIATVEADYCKDSPDIAEGVRLKHLRSGMQHYLAFGHAEYRRCSYTAPLRAPLAVDCQITPDAYTSRIQEIVQSPAAVAVSKIEALLADIISGGCVIAAGDFAQILLREAEGIYLRDYPDVAKAVELEVMTGAEDHWTRHGHAESDRFHIVFSPNAQAIEQAVYDQILGPRVIHETAAFEYQNSRLHGWVAKVGQGA